MATTADLDIVRVAFGPVKAGVSQDNHLTVVLCQQGPEGLVMDVSRGAVSMGDQAPLLLYDAQFLYDAQLTAHDPAAMIGPAFPTHLVGPAPVPYRMAQLKP